MKLFLLWLAVLAAGAWYSLDSSHRASWGFWLFIAAAAVSGILWLYMLMTRKRT